MALPLRSVGGLGLLALAAALSACSPGLYIPNVVGVVTGVEYLAQDTRWTLADGRQFSFPRNGNQGFMNGSEPRMETLLIAGSEPEPWAYWAGIRAPSAVTPDGCYALYGTATADATHVSTTVTAVRGDVTIVFPKAANWVDLGVEGIFGFFNHLKGAYTCINPQGEAFERAF